MALTDPDSLAHPFFRVPDGDAQVLLPDGWDAAVAYPRLRRHLAPEARRVLEERAVRAVLDRARALLRHAHRPVRSVADAWPAPGELDLDETLEHPRPWSPEDLVVRRNELGEADVVAVLDTSLSMTGEKVALTALAVAVMRMRLGRLAVVVFATEAGVLVPVGGDPGVRELVRRVLGVPTEGYTHIRAGLRAAREELRRSRLRERAAVLMSDGIANVGWDPVPEAARLPRLHVVQVGPPDPRGDRACRRMADAGRGRHYRARAHEELPRVVRRLVRECFRS